MLLLYRGFDGLDVSFAGQISAEFAAALAEAKERAQFTHRDAHLAWNGVELQIKESGAKGGYAFIASTGALGATWFFKKPNAHDPWGVRVSCASFQLAMHGLGGARAHLYETLGQLEVRLGREGESIGRVDYALDFLAPEFTLIKDHFVTHSNANLGEHFESVDLAVNGRSSRCTSVTVGRNPGRVVIVYDKRAEIIAKRKHAWWEIWDAALLSSGVQPLIREDPKQSRVWRVEIRAGKHHLKERWNIRRWSDLDARLGDTIAATLDAVRYTTPSEDSNRSRWPDHDLWTRVRTETATDLFEMRTFVDPDLIKRVQAEAHDQLLAAQMSGLLTTRAALQGRKASELPAFATQVGRELSEAVTAAPARYEQKLAEAKSRYHLLDPPKPKPSS